MQKIELCVSLKKLFSYFPRIGRCQAETTGDNVTQGLFFWKTTDASRRISIFCPYESTDQFDEESDIGTESNSDFSGETNPFLLKQIPGQASRNCICTDVICKNPKWDKPVTSRCGYKTFNDSDTTQRLSGLLQVSTCTTVESLRLHVGTPNQGSTLVTSKGACNISTKSGPAAKI